MSVITELDKKVAEYNKAPRCTRYEVIESVGRLLCEDAYKLNAEAKENYVTTMAKWLVDDNATNLEVQVVVEALNDFSDNDPSMKNTVAGVFHNVVATGKGGAYAQILSENATQYLKPAHCG